MFPLGVQFFTAKSAVINKMVVIFQHRQHKRKERKAKNNILRVTATPSLKRTVWYTLDILTIDVEKCAERIMT